MYTGHNNHGELYRTLTFWNQSCLRNVSWTALSPATNQNKHQLKSIIEIFFQLFQNVHT